MHKTKNIIIRLFGILSVTILAFSLIGPVAAQEDEEAAGIKPKEIKKVKAIGSKKTKSENKDQKQQDPSATTEGSEVIEDLDGPISNDTQLQGTGVGTAVETGTGDEIILEDDIQAMPEDSAKADSSPEQVKKAMNRKEAFGKLETFEKELSWDYWFGNGGSSKLFYKRTDKEAYAGQYSLYFEYELGLNTADNWIQMSRTLAKPLDLTGVQSLVFWVKSSGRGGTLSLTLQGPGGTYVYNDYYCLYSTEWTKVTVPVSEAMNSMDVKNITSYILGVTAGVSTASIQQQNARVLTSPNESLPFRSRIYIDEFSTEVMASKIDAGKKKFRYSGYLSLLYANQETAAPYMASEASFQLHLDTPRYLVSANFKIPYNFVNQYLAGDNEDAVTYWTYDFNSKSYGWSYNRPVQVATISANLKQMNSYISTVVFGNISLDYSQLCVGQVYNQTGVNLMGTFPDAMGYNAFYAVQPGKGYSVGGMITPLVSSKIPGLSLYGIFINDDRFARTSSSNSLYEAKLYRSFMNYGGGFAQRIKMRKLMEEMVLEGSYAQSIENNLGSAVLSANSLREPIFVEGLSYLNRNYTTLKLKGDAYTAGLSLNRIFGLRLYEKVEFKKIGADYSGANSGEWVPFLAYTIGNKMHIEILNNTEIIRRFYWKDQIGLSTETKFAIGDLDLMGFVDVGYQDTRRDYRYLNIWGAASYGFSKLNISYDFEKRNWQNTEFSLENEDMLTHEVGLRFKVDNNLLLKGAYQYFHYEKNDSTLYNIHVLFVSLSRRMLSNTIAALTYKNTLSSEGTPKHLFQQSRTGTAANSIVTTSYLNLNMTINF